jgi:hypothetical protein
VGCTLFLRRDSFRSADQKASAVAIFNRVAKIAAGMLIF